MEEMIGESIRPHVEMMSTAEKIKEVCGSLDSINLPKIMIMFKHQSGLQSVLLPIYHSNIDHSH